MWQGKTIVLGVCSSVAIYKALELLRLLQEKGAHVYVVMTPHATELIRPQLFQALSRNPVHVSLFGDRLEDSMPHVGALSHPDLMIVAPATASLIGRYAMGLASDLLTTLLLATTSPVVVAPAMNTQMFQHPFVQQNLQKLESIGVSVVAPKEGELACGIYGAGHLADHETILWMAERALHPQDLKGKRVLISMGATREPLDPVRVLTNRSSGKMGLAVVKAAFVRGARVTVLCGSVSISLPNIPGIEWVFVDSAETMHEAALKYFPSADVFISAAAVADFRPAKFSPQKLKKSNPLANLKLERTSDILSALLPLKRSAQKVVGFALETERLNDAAEKKRLEKQLDVVVANAPSVLDQEGGEFLILDGSRKPRSLRATKEEVGHEIFHYLGFNLS